MTANAKLTALLTICAFAQTAPLTWDICGEKDLFTTTPNNNVTSLDLSNCYLDNVTLTIFNIYPNLQKLNLSDNYIEIIYKEWFHLTLEDLDLSNNLILGKDIKADVFQNAENLNTIRFYGNDMSDSPSDLLKGTNITNIYMSNCKLRQIPEMAQQVGKSLEVMSLANNRISILDHSAFSSFTNLVSLDLRNNSIHCLHKELFQPLTRITEIQLSRNRIRYLPEGLFGNLPTLCFVDLSHNFIEYVPAEAFQHSHALKLNFSNNRITSLPVNFFYDLKRNGPMYLEVFFKNNPWQCACLNQALLEAKRLSVVYDCQTSDSNDCFSSNGDTPICVTNDFKCFRQQELFRLYDKHTGR